MKKTEGREQDWSAEVQPGMLLILGRSAGNEQGKNAQKK
jgi:hypothetical protein